MRVSISEVDVRTTFLRTGPARAAETGQPYQSLLNPAPAVVDLPASEPAPATVTPPAPEVLALEEAALALHACVPDSEKVEREALLADAARELGYPKLTKKVRSSRSQQSIERRA